MNAAFLLVTTAWLAGADAPAKPEAIKAPAAAPAGCTSCCDSCCEKESFLDRLRNKFRRSSCDDCCSKPVVVSCYTKPCCQPAKPVCCKPAKPVCCETKVVHCKPACDSCCDKPSLWERIKARFSRDCDSCDKGCRKSCDSGCRKSCDSGCGCGETKGLLNRLRERMKKDDCCQPCCGSAPAMKTETIPTKPEPKKMPDGIKTSQTKILPETISAPVAPRALPSGATPY